MPWNCSNAHAKICLLLEKGKETICLKHGSKKAHQTIPFVLRENNFFIEGMMRVSA